MGKVTIHVSHAWTLQSAALDDPAPSRPETPKAAVTNRPVTPKQPYKGSLPLAAQVRVTVPSSIAQLVKYYNSCTSAIARRECETASRDILQRLEHLVLASVIHDPVRKDIIRSRMNPTKALDKSQCHPNSIEKTIANPNSLKVNPTALEKTRFFSTEARISVVMLARCKSKHIRDKSMNLLCEALDTNALSTNKHEIMQLQMLWVELVQMFRHVIDARRYNQGIDGKVVVPRGRMSCVSRGHKTVY